MPRDCHVLRVFTREGQGGNHLGVVTDDTGLDSDTMQRLSAELGFSETTFVRTANGVPYVRIFTPTMELPFAGHPLVGTAHVLTRMFESDADQLRCAIGDIAIRSVGDDTWIDVPMTGSIGDGQDIADFVTRAGIALPLRSWLVLLPKDYVVIELATDAAVTEAAPDLDVLAEHFGTYLFYREGDVVHARFFAPDAGVPEDPATGSAAVALATALENDGEQSGELTIFQGEEVGHPSQIELAWRSDVASIGGSSSHDETRILEV